MTPETMQALRVLRHRTDDLTAMCVYAISAPTCDQHTVAMLLREYAGLGQRLAELAAAVARQPR